MIYKRNLTVSEKKVTLNERNFVIESLNIIHHQRNITVKKKNDIVKELNIYHHKRDIVFRRLKAIHYIIDSKITELLTSLFAIDNNIIIKLQKHIKDAVFYSFIQKSAADMS